MSTTIFSFFLAKLLQFIIYQWFVSKRVGVAANGHGNYFNHQKIAECLSEREFLFCVCFRFGCLITKDLELIWKFRLIANERESIKTKYCKLEEELEGCQNISLQKQLLHAELLWCLVATSSNSNVANCGFLCSTSSSQNWAVQCKQNDGSDITSR